MFVCIIRRIFLKNLIQQAIYICLFVCLYCLTYHAAVLGADEKGRLDAGLAHLVPVQADLLHQSLLQPDEPLLGHAGRDEAVAGADQAALHLLLLVVPLQRAAVAVGSPTTTTTAVAEGLGPVHVPGLGSPVKEPNNIKNVS